jgi:heme/copper-type cytochrome/quinol oxidase subunit 4
MGQILHGSATTTEAVRRAIQHSQESLIALTGLSLVVAEQLAWRAAATVTIFALAAVKAYLVITHYMETDRALLQWRALYPLWAAVIGLILIVGHLLA